MRLLPMWMLCAVCCAAGVIKGVVLEHATGNALSRTLVRLEPVAGSGTATRIAPQRTGRAGQFVFASVPDGMYFLIVERSGFHPISHGQRRPQGHGLPIAVNRDTDLFTELRMRRMGALTGTVTDENGVGIANVNLLAYRARLPLRIAGRGVSDDRGVFRVPGLDAGKYWVRTAGHTLDDGTGLMPTFGPQSMDTRYAVVHTVSFDGDTPDANIRPEPGGLFTLEGKIICDEKDAVELTLSSDSLHLTKGAGCDGAYSFTGLPPGEYDLRAEYLNLQGSGFLEINLGGNMVQPISVTRGQPMIFDMTASSRVTVMARREDLSGPGPWKEVPPRNGYLATGNWVLQAAMETPDRYVKSMVAAVVGRSRRRLGDRPPDGYAAFVRSGVATHVRIALSDGAGTIGGTVSDAGKPSPGAPVFLWPVLPDARRVLGGPAQTFADVNGQFRFTGLPGGEYRLLATFDAREATEELMEEAKASSIRVEERQTAAAQLTLWNAP